MSNIQRFMEMLKSDDPNKRYDACEELRVSQYPLPQEAMDALNAATNDSSPEVADAAQRAFSLHTPTDNDKESDLPNDRNNSGSSNLRGFGVGCAGFLIGTVMTAIVIDLLFEIGGGTCFESCFSLILMVSPIAGLVIGTIAGFIARGKN